MFPAAAGRASFSGPAVRRSRKTVKRREEEAMTTRPEDREPEVDPAERGEEEEAAQRTEPVTPPIDEEVAGSVNAAVPERDE